MNIAILASRRRRRGTPESPEPPLPPEPDFLFDPGDLANEAALRALIGNWISTYSNPAKAGTATFGNAVFGDGRNADLFNLDESITYNGRKTLAATFPPSSNTTGILRSGLAGGTLHVWIRRKLRFVPGFTLLGGAAAYKYGASVWWSGGGIDGRVEAEYENATQTNLKASITGGVFSSNTTSLGVVGDEWDDGLWYEDVIGYQTLSSTQVEMYGAFGPPGGPYIRASSMSCTANEGKTIPAPALLSIFNENWNNNRGAGESYQINYGPIEVWYQENPLGLL